VLDHYTPGVGFAVGLSMSHNIAHMARAVMEGVAYHVRWICETLERLGYHFDTSTPLAAAARAKSGRRSSAT